MIRHGAAAVRNDEAQRREVLEQIALDQLHERGRVGVDVMRAGGVETGVAAGGDVDHGGNVVLHHLLVDRIPVAVRQRRAGPVSARRIGIEVDADEAIFLDAFFQFGDAGFRVDAGALRQHGGADEMVGEELRDAKAEFVADRGPGRGDPEVADVMGHEAGAGRKDRKVAAPLLHQLQLVRFNRLAQLVVADLQVGDLGLLRGVLDAGDLLVAPGLECLGAVV